jgi:exodeoxyribonuclease VII small subunit
MPNPKNEKPLSDQLRELDELIAWFDQDDFDLDEALKRFDEGVKLTEAIEERLGKLENKITVLKQRFGEGGLEKAQ